MPPSMTFDVLGLGAVALDEFLYVDAYPAPDTKVRARESRVQCGGLTGNALVTAARMGARCAYAGRLGTSAAAKAIEEGFAGEGVDTRHASRRAEDGVVTSTIIVGTEGNTRNVFSRRNGITGARESEPSADVVESARVLFLDHHAGPGGVRAGRIAAAAGIPIVADFERQDAPCLDELLELTGHLIVPAHFACAITGASSPSDAILQLATSAREVTVVTNGAEGFWWVEKGGQPNHVPAFVVEVADTACCGDVFHGAYAAALAEGVPLRARLRFASAAAALKATRIGGQQSIPRRGEVDAFLERHGG